jgi:hypothetical protein
MRNMIFAQRTGLPAQLARTGSALTPTDEYAMSQYENAAVRNTLTLVQESIDQLWTIDLEGGFFLPMRHRWTSKRLC